MTSINPAFNKVEAFIASQARRGRMTLRRKMIQFFRASKHLSPGKFYNVSHEFCWCHSLRVRNKHVFIWGAGYQPRINFKCYLACDIAHLLYQTWGGNVKQVILRDHRRQFSCRKIKCLQGSGSQNKILRLDKDKIIENIGFFDIHQVFTRLKAY